MTLHLLQQADLRNVYNFVSRTKNLKHHLRAELLKSTFVLYRLPFQQIYYAIIIIIITDNSFYSNDKFTTYKDKEIPVQAWTSPEGSKRLRLPDYKTVGT